MGRKIHLNNIKVTENIGVFKVHSLWGNWVGRVKKHLTFTVELNGVSGFVHFLIALDCRGILSLLHLHSEVLFSHILDVVHEETRAHPLKASSACSHQVSWKHDWKYYNIVFNLGFLFYKNIQNIYKSFQQICLTYAVCG